MELQDYERDHIAIMRKLAPECMVLLKARAISLWKAGKRGLYGNGARKTVKGPGMRLRGCVFTYLPYC